MAHEQAVMTVDTETASEVDALVSAQQPASTGRRVVLGAVGVAAMVAAGAVATSLAAPAQESSASWVVSQATESHRMGCSNWAELLLAEEASSDDTKCSALCAKTAGCHAYNVQEDTSCPNTDGNEGKAPGTCFVFAKGCQKKANNCWDLWEESNATDVSKVNKARMGCSNWASIKFKEFKGLSPEQCGAKCAEEATCKHYNIQVSQADHCPGTSTVGTCYLFNGDCQEKANDCWDLYDNLLFTTTTAPATTTA
jgi:hypothetical protein